MNSGVLSLILIIMFVVLTVAIYAIENLEDPL